MLNELVDIRSDGRVVWVDGPGGCIGRFGLNGIDVHTADASGCLHCTHERTTAADWDIFVAKMLEHHNVAVGQEHKPSRFRGALDASPAEDQGSRQAALDYIADAADDRSFALAMAMANGATLTVWQRDDLLTAVQDSQPLPGRERDRERAIAILQAHLASPVIDARTGRRVA